MRTYSCFVFAILTLSGGCGPSANGPPLYPSTGTILSSGKPASGVLVRLHPMNGAVGTATPAALTGSDGAFVLETEGLAGAPEGEYAVTLTWPPPPGLGPPGGAGTDRLKGRHANPAQPFARVTIRSETNQLGPFQID